MAIKSITLTGTETIITGLDGCNAAIRNDSADTAYFAKRPGATPGADGVLPIPAGQSAVLFGISGAVYAIGTGEAIVISSDFNDNPFKSAAQGGSGADEVARAAINAHAGNADIHVTADEKAAWSAVSNPNLLINPDFRINQRGAGGTISTPGYFVDRWKLISGSVKVNSDGTLTLNGTISQTIENSAGANVTASANEGTASYDDSTKTFSLTSTGNTISWAKLEMGGAATLFTPPDPTLELAKCQRYLTALDVYKRYPAAYYNGTNMVNFLIPLNSAMRDIPTIEGEMKVYASRFLTSGMTPEEDGTISVVGRTDNGILVRWTKNNHGLTDACLEVQAGTLLSAEIL